MLTRVVLKRIAVVWIICLIVLSLLPFRPPGTRDHLSYKHQVEHVLAFGATALLLLALARSREEALKALGGVVLLAVAIEISQYLIYSLSAFEWWDVREDSIGALIAFAAHRIRPFAVVSA